jgi:hypothetical protein
MQRPTFARVPDVLTICSSLPPMYAWPTPVKRVILGACILCCVVAYATMAAAILSLATLVLGLV